MTRYETVTEPARERKAPVARVCDLCGREATQELNDWDGGRFEVCETEITARFGDSYPEGGSGTSYEIDLCPDCFRGRLIPWLRSQGAKIEEKEWHF